MKAGHVVFALCLCALMAGTAFSSGDAPDAMGTGGDRRGRDLSDGLGKAVFTLDCGCPDLAYTESFKARGLGYVYSTEFADAVHAVASGNSRYSPREIPGEWQAAAADWQAYLAAHPHGAAAPANPTASMDFPAKLDGVPFLGKEACSPALLYLSSLEYRSRPGHHGVTLVFPRLVRAAAFDLGTQVVAKSRMAEIYAKRTAVIGAKIAEADRIGAGECSPSELAHAKSELDRARRDAAEVVRTGIQETERSFARAEKIADTLLTHRQFASRNGFKCYPE